MSYNYNGLKPLTPLTENKTVVFRTSMEGEDTLTRTGFESDTESLVNSILYSCSNKDKLKEKIKKCIVNKHIKEFRSLAEKTTSSVYCFITNKPGSKGILTKKVLKILLSKDSIEPYQIVSELVPISYLKNHIFNIKLCSNICQLKNNYEVSIIEHLKDNEIFKNVDKKRISKIEEYATQLFNTIFTTVQTYVMENTKISIADLADLADINIYTINSETRLPVAKYSCDSEKARVLIEYESGDYEVVGKCSTSKSVVRNFTENDTFIRKINNIL